MKCLGERKRKAVACPQERTLPLRIESPYLFMDGEETALFTFT